MNKNNYHTHTTRCYHASGNDEEYVKAAIQANIKELGFSDHTPWHYDSSFKASMRMPECQLDDYIESIRYLKEKYKDQISIFTKTGQSFYEGTTYSNMQVTDAYTQVAKEAARSTAFDKDVKNLGVAPMPTGPFNDTGLFPGHVPQGYAVGKGASDKSVAACYALFESRLTDTDSGEAYQMPTDVRAVIEKNFAEKPFLSQQFGFQDSAGNNIQLILDNQLGKKIMEGADVASMLSSYRNVITRTINDSIS